MTTYSRIPTSPTAPAFKSLLEKLDYKAIDEELNKVIAVTSPGNPYEIKLHLMRYDFQFNQDYLDRYTELYGGRWANGEERLELGMTPEESYIHWDKTMNFALRNGAVVIVLWRIKGTNDEWKFGIGSHCFDMADMTLPDYQALHPPSYQPWADVFDKLFVDYRKDDLVHGRYFYNNSTCRVDELKVNGMTVASHVYSIVGGSLGMIGCHVIVLSTKLQGKIYKPIEKESHVVRVVEFTEVYDCKPEQKALLAIRATNIYFKREEMEELRYKIVRAYDKMQEKARRAQL